MMDEINNNEQVMIHHFFLLGEWWGKGIDARPSLSLESGTEHG
jgi:hypothetical protein